MVRNPFRRKKEEQTIEVEVTDLAKICGKDREVYEALLHTMFLTPQKITTTMEEAAKKGASYEKKKNKIQAGVWYHIAGGLALWKGDVDKVKQFFGKCSDLAPEMECEVITKIPERAVKKAQEYYKTFLT